MDYTVKKLPKSEVELTIIVSEEKLETYKKKASEEVSRDVKIPGFRPGHVPADVLSQHVDQKYIIARAQELAIQHAYADAVVKENLQVVARPKIHIEKDSPLTFKATVAVLPEVEIKDYKSIKVEKKAVKVDEKEVEEVLNDFKKYTTTYKDTDRAAKKDDRVELDFEGFDHEDKALPNTKSENHPVIIGGGSLVPGFEDNLIGLKKDDKKEFHVTFPKDYHKKDFQEKKVKFKVHMKAVKEPVVPEMTEELIEKMTGKKESFADFKKTIEKNVLAKKEAEAKNDRENKYIEELIKKAKIELPESLIEEEVEYILEDMKADIQEKGMEFEKYLEQSKTTEAELKKKYKGEAEKRLKIRLSLQHLISEEKLEVTPAEVKEEFDKMKTMYPKHEQAHLDEEFSHDHFQSQLKSRILLKKLFEKVLA